MTALFVALTILFFLGLDALKRRYEVRQKQEIYLGDVGLTMADGGEKIEEKKDTNSLDTN